jgi:alanine racemase
MSTEKRSRAWIDVSAQALRQNFRTVQEAVGEGVRVIPLVKADAYGLGVAEAISALQPLDPWGFGVAVVEEGVGIRDMGVEKPVIVFSPVPPSSYRAAVRSGLSVAVGDLQGLVHLRQAARESGSPGRFHLEVDTGMGRAGFDWHRVDRWGPEFAALMGPPLRWEGCFTHFHSADSVDEGPTVLQWERLLRTVDSLPTPAEAILLHACNSPGALRMPGFAGDAVRPGIFLYGGVAGDGLPDPAPVASLRARIVFLRDAIPGATAGYGSTYSASQKEVWASVGIGYGDGLPRLLGNRGEGLVRGRRAAIIGRISMDLTVLNVSEVPGVQVGDTVTFFGRTEEGEGAGRDEITLEEVAGHAQTINYEILTGLTQRLPRIWTGDGGY